MNIFGNDIGAEEDYDEEEVVVYFEGVIWVHARLSPQQMAPTHVLSKKKNSAAAAVAVAVILFFIFPYFHDQIKEILD